MLDAGDMLYLPPRWAHDGVAAGGDCMTCSIGMRAPAAASWRTEVLQRMLGLRALDDDDPLYRDPRQPATRRARQRSRGACSAFAGDAVRGSAARAAAARARARRSAERAEAARCGSTAARRWRLRRPCSSTAAPACCYDEQHVFINGEPFSAAGRDAKLMSLADRRTLDAREVAALSEGARELLDTWAEAGWLHARDDTADGDRR